MVFSTFDWDQVPKIHWLAKKNAFKLVRMPRLNMIILVNTDKDIVPQSHRKVKFYRCFYGGGKVCVPHFTKILVTLNLFP